MQANQTSKLKRNKKRLKEYLLKKMKKWRKPEQKYGYHILEKEKDEKRRFYKT